LHPRQPVERNVEIILQADIELVIDSSSEFAYKGVKSLYSKDIRSEKLDLSPNSVQEDELAYILFTSGSTGKPKGVPITRKNVGAFMKSFWQTGIAINEFDRCLQCFDLTFDVSVQSFLVPLTQGACTYTIPHDQIKYSYVYGFDEINVPSMRYSILTAEASPFALIEEWSKCIPNAEIFNFYGPTEATIYCTYHKFNRNGGNKQLNGMLSVGKAMPGLTAIIIDDERNILNPNQKGELCICGDQLTPGYWKNPEKNKDSFFELSHDGELHRFYKTGDSCFFDEEGDIMLAGRLDHQVKIQGYRIELGEIEYHAREFLKGQNAIAVDFCNQMGNTEIALFIEGALCNKSDLVAYLNGKMPYYMIPTMILVENNFPINTSGKTDRIKLKGQLIQ
jgi:non-ribosomal peptide synthetase component F